jgi:hypothetical protein
LTALHSLADEVNKMEKPSRRLDFYDLLIEALKSCLINRFLISQGIFLRD